MGRLRPHLERVCFALGEVVYESGGRQSHIYFPTTAIISLLYLMENGSSAEMGVAGCEGLVGVALFMGGNTVPNRAVVQSAGAAFRMKTKVLQEEFARGGLFQRLLRPRRRVADGLRLVLVRTDSRRRRTHAHRHLLRPRLRLRHRGGDARGGERLPRQAGLFGVDSHDQALARSAAGQRPYVCYRTESGARQR